MKITLNTNAPRFHQEGGGRSNSACTEARNGLWGSSMEERGEEVGGDVGMGLYSFDMVEIERRGWEW